MPQITQPNGTCACCARYVCKPGCPQYEGPPPVQKCLAKQYSDFMTCDLCRQSWDVNDPTPPACRTGSVANKSLDLRWIYPTTTWIGTALQVGGALCLSALWPSPTFAYVMMLGGAWIWLCEGVRLRNWPLSLLNLAFILIDLVGLRTWGMS